MYLEMLLPLTDINATKYDIAYAKAAQAEMIDGILIDTEFACRVCTNQLQLFFKRLGKKEKEKWRNLTTVVETNSMLAVEASEESDDSTSDTSDDSSDSDSGSDSDSDSDSCVDDASDGDGDREDKKSTSDSELHERSSFNVPSNQPRRVPKLALVNKHFRGATPIELSRLTRVELSMVSLVNCIYTLTMLKRGYHWGSTATVFSVLNE
jgi:hypothetical protein